MISQEVIEISSSKPLGILDACLGHEESQRTGVLSDVEDGVGEAECRDGPDRSLQRTLCDQLTAMLHQGFIDHHQVFKELLCGCVITPFFMPTRFRMTSLSEQESMPDGSRLEAIRLLDVDPPKSRFDLRQSLQVASYRFLDSITDADEAL
ncbi:unannotated protein [freshwater metagenome]|uniref:Unannotated protein n=1 Tax=freshwater metagenome TaxID=449393 RepID=A0A6J6DI56_9ZZZZ